MGKKPVLGLVGLCVSLVLSGCKDCGCGGWLFSRKEPAQPVARVRRPATDDQTARVRSVPDRSTTVMSDGDTRMKKIYDYDPKEHSAPASTTDLVETPHKVTSPLAREKPSTAVSADPTLAEIESVIKPASEKQTITPAAPAMDIPAAPMSQGEMPMSSSTAPVDATRIDPPSFKGSVPAKLPDSEAPTLDTKPAIKEPKASEVPSLPPGLKTVEPAAMPALAPAPTPAPIAIPTPPAMGIDVPPPASMGKQPTALPSEVPSSPLPATLPDLKGPPPVPAAPPAGPDLGTVPVMPPPPPPPAPPAK
jgi:predicted  nucleic acid-binding Zn-ribbon protein